MFTVCPKCALTLVVTAADLRVAQGYVRCGRCSSVFNALAQLSDERHAAASGPAAASAAPPEPRQSPAPDPAAKDPLPEDPFPEDALEFDPSRTDVNAVFVAPPPDPQWTAATGSFKALRAQGGTAAPGPPADAPVDVEIDPALLAGIVHAATRPAPGESASTPAARLPGQVAHTRRATDRTPSAPQPQPEASPARAAIAAAAGSAAGTAEADAAAEEILPAPHPLARLVARLGAPHSARAAIGVAVLVIVLAAQMVNHSRDALATHARLNRPLTALYGVLGVRLMPHWDLHAYDVRQLGAAVDPGNGGEITVRASIRNGGRQPQPLPLLRVTLQDRFGTPLAARDVAPRDYLPGAVPPSSFLSVDQRIDAEMAFVDPGSRAVGFEIDACLPLAGGAVSCANDPVSR